MIGRTSRARPWVLLVRRLGPHTFPGNVRELRLGNRTPLACDEVSPGKRSRDHCRRCASATRSSESTMNDSWRCYLLASVLALATVTAAHAQTGSYPSKPVQIIADSSAGSTPDVALRFVA